ncbi:hypothetical protein VB711_00590 [Cronbergia sp. UHCC 0137]|uniref:hypothetical protein n=1 Tax=Cronbergia sp. UHCC 0137 TaxID=3110239 RepID=UPI002B1EFBAB|nr:hypothetical protein [Cronbergia sp. UHCC 0137]MEA5616340.1 hypothetical protein [Cronbergia sp. UHCC 0137]
MIDVVTNDELLYRCVFGGLNKYYRFEESELKLSSQAFTDRNQAPSVDRAKLCGFNPKYTQKNPNDGIISLIAGEVRAIDSIVQSDAKGNQLFVYKIDVCSRPTDENLAHAQIEPSPDYTNKNTFRKVAEKLARLATERVKKQGWEIEPCELRT